jgi:hypothetical protein
MAWNNYESLRHSQALQNMVENLTCDIFDKNIIKEGVKSRISQIETNPYMYPLSGMESQIMTIYNTDLMLQ